MSLLTLTNKFGALNNRAEPHIIGPNAAQALSNVVLDSLGIVPQKTVGATVATGSGTARSLCKFNSTYIISTEARQYVEYGGQLIYCVAGQAPKRTADGTTFYNLGIKAPQIAPTAAAGAAGVLTGDFTYYVTFTNALDWESGPSPAGTVTLAAQQGSLSALATHLGTGSITTGSPTVTSVTNISAYQVGMNIIGQDSAAASAPAAGVGIPAGTTILSIDTGASTITLSANATATTAGIRITDPQCTGRKLYRASSDTAKLVTTFPDMTTLAYVDNTTTANLGAPITTTSYDVPPLLASIAVSPYGVLGGSFDSKFYFSEDTLPYAWKPASFRQFNETIVGVTATAAGFLVLTGVQPYLVLGTNGTTFRIVMVPSQQGCLGRDTIVDMGDAGVFYLSPDGLCSFNGGGVDVISKGSLSDAFMAGVSATNAKAARYNERYILFAQSGASFASGGYLEWDSRTQGNWKVGTLTANAASYSRADDILYVAQTADVKAWEGGAAGSTSCSYQTGDWIDGAYSTLKHWRGAAVDHNGTVTATVYIDGVQVGSVQTLVRTTLGRSFWRFPAGSRGRRISVKVAGTGTTWRVVEILTDAGDVARRM